MYVVAARALLSNGSRYAVVRVEYKYTRVEPPPPTTWGKTARIYLVRYHKVSTYRYAVRLALSTHREQKQCTSHQNSKTSSCHSGSECPSVVWKSINQLRGASDEIKRLQTIQHGHSATATYLLVKLKNSNSSQWWRNKKTIYKFSHQILGVLVTHYIILHVLTALMWLVLLICICVKSLNTSRHLVNRDCMIWETNCLLFHLSILLRLRKFVHCSVK